MIRTTRDAIKATRRARRSRSGRQPGIASTGHVNVYYLAAHHAQIRGRRGTQKAVGATRHDILIAYYHIVRDRVPYQDLGPDWNDRRRSAAQQTRRLVRQLERLGVTVTITPGA